MHSRRGILKCVREGVYPVQDAVFGNDYGTSDGLVAELNRVIDYFRLDLLGYDAVTLVMF